MDSMDTYTNSPQYTATEAVFDLVHRTTTIVLVDHAKTANKIAATQRLKRSLKQGKKKKNVLMDNNFTLYGHDDRSDDEETSSDEDTQYKANRTAFVELNEELDSFEKNLLRLQEEQAAKSNKPKRVSPSVGSKPRSRLASEVAEDQAEEEALPNWTDDLEIGPQARAKHRPESQNSWVTTPEELGRQLSTLRLESLKITELGSDFIPMFPRLKELDLTDNRINQIPVLPQGLEKVSINLNHLKRFELQYDLPNLVHCGLAFNPIDSISPNLLQHMPQLLSLDLSYTELVDLESLLYSLEPVSEILHHLSLQGCPCALLPRYRLRVIQSMPRLTVFDDIPLTIEETEAQEDGLEPIPCLPHVIFSIAFKQLVHLPDSIYLPLEDTELSKSDSKKNLKKSKSKNIPVANPNPPPEETILVEVKIIGGQETERLELQEMPLSSKILFEEEDLLVPKVQTPSVDPPSRSSKKGSKKPPKKPEPEKAEEAERPKKQMVLKTQCNPSVELRDGIKFTGMEVLIYHIEKETNQISNDGNDDGAHGVESKKTVKLLSSTFFPLHQFLEPSFSVKQDSATIHELLNIEVNDDFISHVRLMNEQKIKKAMDDMEEITQGNEEETPRKERNVAEEVKVLMRDAPELSISVTLNDPALVQGTYDERNNEIQARLELNSRMEDLSIADLSRKQDGESASQNN